MLSSRLAGIDLLLPLEKKLGFKQLLLYFRDAVVTSGKKSSSTAASSAASGPSLLRDDGSAAAAVEERGMQGLFLPTGAIEKKALTEKRAVVMDAALLCVLSFLV